MNEQTFEVYDILAKHNLQLYFSAFNQILKVYQKRDFILLCREDLQKVGLTSRYSIQLFENLLETLKDKRKAPESTVSFNYAEFYINTVLPNQEPVIIGSSDVTQEEALGSGHFGKVYKGSWQRKTPDGKAVKVPVAIKTLSDGTEMSWKKEVTIFTALNQNHSNIIKFFGLLIGEEDKIKMITEFAPFGSLLDRLRAKQITSISTLSQYAVQIAAGMVYLHSKNLVHRDLSARNILVTGKNQVKISDFGLSKVLGQTQTEWVMDSAESLPMRWLAPESLNNGVFTTSSDVWSFAVALWEMFTFGEVPWGDFDNEQVKVKITNGTFLPEPKFCPSGMYEVMKMCWSCDQFGRPPFHIIREELLNRQPATVEAIESSNGNYDLNFIPGEFVTCIKALSDSTWWLGQHESNLSFGRFRLDHTKTISYTLPYSLDDEEVKEDQQKGAGSTTTQSTSAQQDHSDMAPHSFENKENLLYEPAYQVPTEASYVNMAPLQQTTALSQHDTPQTRLKVETPSLVQTLIRETKQEKSRPHSEVLSSRKDFFDLDTDMSRQLKSGSDSKLGFKDTKPEVQETVNDRIARNMTAFLSLSNPISVSKGSTERSTSYLSPVDISCVKPKPTMDLILKSVDPLSNAKSLSCENIYEEIDNNYIRTGRDTQTLRPRPKGKPAYIEETSGPSAYRKSSLDAYAQSVKKDFDLLAQQLGPTKPSVQSCGNLPKNIQVMNVATKDLYKFPNVQNTQFLQKFSSAVPIRPMNHTPQQPVHSSIQSNTMVTQQTLLNPGVNTTIPQKSPDYFNNFLLDKEPNHFTYDPNAKTMPVPEKEKSKASIKNYRENDWDLFEDCVKDSKKIDKNRKKSLVKRISWPKSTEAMGGQRAPEKEEFSDKFKKIRFVLPDATVGECLEGLRSSKNDVDGAVRYIKILKLYRYNYGYSFEDCERILEDCSCNFARAEKTLKVKYVKDSFSFLERAQIKETLNLCNWNTNTALKTIFVQQCNDFGISEPKAASIYNENQESVTKALEMAKIVRVAEITSKPEHFCFKILTHCKWDIQRSVNHIFSKS